MKPEKNPEQKPPTPTCAGTQPESADSTPTPTANAKATALLRTLSQAEARLALSPADIASLTPLAEPWLATGLTLATIRATLTAGLPTAIHSPKALIADRLQRKLPDRTPDPTPNHHQRLTECARCRDPLPRTSTSPNCAACTPPPSDPPDHQSQRPDFGPLHDRVNALRTLLSAGVPPVGLPL
ncbi:hypothetical protein [Streptomyces sp. NPDC086989]|uniref:hypothetical protein n=1 Tax=Streptomyces sp. NPDC086989 TaxID=3365764 RepID=UPI00382E6DE8